MAKYGIGKYYTFTFPGRKREMSGIVLDYNGSWTLIALINDYTFNGFMIFNNNKAQYKSGEYEKFASKIFKLKHYAKIKNPKVPLDSLENILSFLDKKYKLIGIETDDGEAMDVLKYLGKQDALYVFDELTIRAKWRFKLRLPEKEIKYLEFGNNYINSLKLVTKFKRSNLKK